MPGLLTCLLALLPLTAEASDSKWLAEGAEAVQIEGTVEVPFYRGAPTQGLPALLATVPNAENSSEVFFHVALAGAGSMISKGQATSLGWKVNKAKKTLFFQLPGYPMGAEVMWAVAPKIQLGTLTLENVHFLVTEKGPAVLDLGAVEEIATAILPSQGILRFVSSDKADTLLEGMETVVEGKRVAARGKTWVHGIKIPGLSSRLTFPLRAAENEMNGILSLTTMDSIASMSRDGLSTRTIHGAHWVDGEAVVDKVTLSGPYIVGAAGELLDGEYAVGYGQLLNVDFVVDPKTARLGLNPVTQGHWVSTRSKELEIAKGKFENGASKTVDGAQVDSTEAESNGPDKKEAGRQRGYAGALLQQGDLNGAIGGFSAAISADPTDCSLHLSLAKAHFEKGEWDAAATAAAQSAELWQTWMSQDLETRLRVENKQKVGEDVSTLQQSPACYESYEVIAGSRLMKGDHKGVAEVYGNHMDLMSNVAYAYGMSLLQTGETAQAHGPIRQALNLGNRANAKVRLGLGFAALKDGNAAVAEKQLSSVLNAYRRYQLKDLLSGLHLAKELGADAAMDFVTTAVDNQPESAAAWLTYGLLHHQLGKDPSSYKASLDAALVAENARYFDAGFSTCNAGAARALYGAWTEADTLFPKDSGFVHTTECDAAGRLISTVSDSANVTTTPYWHPIVLMAPVTDPKAE